MVPVSCLCVSLSPSYIKNASVPIASGFFSLLRGRCCTVGTVSQPAVIQTPKLYSGVWRLRGQGVLETDSGAGCTVLWVHLLPQD